MMDVCRLGALGVVVPRLILGCGNFGGIGSAPAFYGMGEGPDEARSLLDAAWEAGIFAFDTADAYGGGRSETAIGAWIGSRGSRVRDQTLLSSKVFNPVGPGPNERGLSRLHICRQVEASLRRLQTDWIDLYLIHDVDAGTPWDETLAVLTDLVRAGKVRYLGASNIAAWQVATANRAAEGAGRTPFGWVQNGYSLIDRRAEREMLPYCAMTGLGFTAFSPLAGGWLTGKYRSGATFPADSRMTLRPEPYGGYTTDTIFRGVERFVADAARRGVAPATLATAWLLQQPQVTAAIIGARRPGHIQEARAALDLRLSPSELEDLRALFPESPTR